MPMKIYSLVLFFSMISYLGRLIYLSKEQDRLYKALLYSVVVFYILAFINDFPHIFLGEERSILGKYFTEGLAPFFFIMFFLILLQFFLFLKFYPFRWIYSGFYWVLCVRLAIGYLYEPNFGEKNLLPYVAGGAILSFYLWVILFIYRRKWYCKILLCILSLWIFAFWFSTFLVNVSINFLAPLKLFLENLYFLKIFIFLIMFPLGFLGGPIFYLIFYIGEVLVLGCIKAEIENKEHGKLKESSKGTS